MKPGNEELLALMFSCDGCGHPFHFGECPVRVWASGDKDACGCTGEKKKASCNRHNDCDKHPKSDHCYDEGCEDCFGK